MKLMGLGALMLVSGCSLCAPGFLDDYATVGGKWQRSDPTQGRVGSVFSDPGTTIGSGLGPGVAGYGEGEYYEESMPGEYYEGDYPQDAEVDFYGPAGETYDDNFSDAAQQGEGVIILGEDW
ncbi:MAG: hypothetical protein KDA45_17335 [Planctomycetales bacterium]|nr:hypothetical protein [Planctomycetales bacterium]